MVHPHESIGRPSLPNAKRHYVAPLLLARGRGKKLRELHSSKSLVGDKSCIDNGSKLLKNNKGSAIHFKSHPKMITPCVVGNDEEGSFDPLFAPVHPFDKMPTNDRDSFTQSYYDDDTADNEFQSSCEEHDMHIDAGVENANNDLEIGNANDNIFEDANDNVLEISPAAQQDGNGTASELS